ncbi:hypothetical protein CORC01_06332 [Colletotrichum orchidophilum]|uniref:DUF7708 domain-containing protein n=1 Tax=Colletotrichum orchidophilum TaxID=1209926 RepID=A0A1G4BAJ8_9PEZI|nr:uncharacterized protein CORC01_06332 [Colletotrichum orchidophilum]OHE98336.1 hypothetical protein CORC01_06332 [Colletotrichum orchidophilum]
MLIAKKIATTSSLEEAHSSDNRVSKRAGRGLCDFFVGFQGYCQAYSGVVQLMGGLDQSFVTGALQVLGLFLVVAVNKRETETRIHGMIKTLTSEYARIRKIVGIYSSSIILRECVATVYRLGIEFLREATVYYSYGSWRRLWHVISSPPHIDLDAKISDLRSAIDELVKERDVEAHLRLGRVESKINASLEQTKHERSDARLEKIRTLLDLPRTNASNQLKAFASLLETEFSHLRKLPPFQVDALTSNISFSGWLEEAAHIKSSTFLLIQGRTIAPWDSPLAWASQATVEAVRLLQDKQAISAWYLCKSDSTQEPGSTNLHPVPTAALVLLSLGYQLLETTSAGRAVLAESSSPDSEPHIRDLLDKVQTCRSMVETRKAGKGHVAAIDCSKAAMAFLRASIASIAQNTCKLLPDPGQVVFHLAVDRFEVLPQHDTLLLEPLMDLVQRPEPGTAVKVIVVGERQFGGDSRVSEFVANYQDSSAWKAIELDQGS